MIDAALFVPQSRPRVFIVAIDSAVTIPANIVAAAPTAPFHTPELVAACARNASHKPIWWRLPVPPRRNTVLADLIEDAPTGVSWHSKSEVDRLIVMMTPTNLDKLKAAQRASLSFGKRMIGAYLKRRRPNGVGGTKVQRIEIRFDDVAGCLRMASGGGSSIQDIIVVEGGHPRPRVRRANAPG